MCLQIYIIKFYKINLKTKSMASANKQYKGLSNTSYVQIKCIESLLQQRAQFAKYMKPIGLADNAVYYYTKQASFFGKKQDRTVFTFFQGLNTNPQNLSIFLRDMVNSLNKNSKQKLSKGQFIVYDIFNDIDCVVEISIPGNFQIYKIKNGKKQLISNKQIQSMYVSSVLRSMYEKNLVWGKSYNLFGCKNMLEGFRQFLGIFFKVAEKNDVVISEDYEHRCTVKGSHICSILLDFVKAKRIVHHTIDIIEKQVSARGGYSQVFPKLLILLSQLYSYDGKYAKSLYIISTMLKKYENDPFLLYYEAKYMLKLVAVHEALIIINSIVQYNQFQIWCLAAELHIQLKNYSEGLICLNHASKIAGRSAKQAAKNIQIQTVYAQFQKLGKKYTLGSEDEVTQRPKLMVVSENPASIVGSIQQKFKTLVDNQYWRMGYGQRVVCKLLRTLRYRLQTKKFQQLLESTFEQSKKQYVSVNFKAGLSQSMFTQTKAQIYGIKQEINPQKQQEQQLPNFLKDQSIQIQAQQVKNGNRNLSIIPELQSVIQNSQFEEKQKQTHKIVAIRVKKQLSQTFYKIIKSVLGQSEIQKAEFEENWAKVLPIYNKLRTAAKLNSYYTHQMFEIMMKIQNYKSIIVLIAESLDAYEQLLGSKEIDVLPFWMQTYIFQIVEEKGLKFLNTLLEKMDFLDAAVIDTIELAKNWKIKGCTF